MDTSAGVDGTCSWAALGGFMRNMVQESSLTGRALRIVEVASMLGVSVKTVRRMVAAGLFPKAFKVGPGAKLARWSVADVTKYLDGLRVGGKGA